MITVKTDATLEEAYRALEAGDHVFGCVLEVELVNGVMYWKGGRQVVGIDRQIINPQWTIKRKEAL